MVGRSPALLGCLAVMATGQVSNATVVVSQSIEEMAQGAKVIVEGRVGQIQARWDEAGSHISTYAEITLTRPLKGQATKTFLVKQPGGVVDGVGQYVSGAARFSPGEDVLLFLEPAADEPGVFIVYALAAGKFTFRPNALGELRAVRDLTGLSFYVLGATGDSQIRSLDKSGDEGAAEAFRKRIRNFVLRPTVPRGPGR
jgi:hypothetical protein